MIQGKKRDPMLHALSKILFKSYLHYSTIEWKDSNSDSNSDSVSMTFCTPSQACSLPIKTEQALQAFLYSSRLNETLRTD